MNDLNDLFGPALDSTMKSGSRKANTGLTIIVWGVIFFFVGIGVATIKDSIEKRFRY